MAGRRTLLTLLVAVLTACGGRSEDAPPAPVATPSPKSRLEAPHPSRDREEAMRARDGVSRAPEGSSVEGK
jgi:hypothetical protein